MRCVLVNSHLLLDVVGEGFDGGERGPGDVTDPGGGQEEGEALTRELQQVHVPSRGKKSCQY